MPAPERPLPQVDADWVADNARELMLIDLRDASDYRGRLGHILGSVRLDPADLVARAKAEWTPQTGIVLICKSGQRSARLGFKLMDMGFPNVMVLRGGMVEWNRRGHAVRLSAKALTRDNADSDETFAMPVVVRPKSD